MNVQRVVPAILLLFLLFPTLMAQSNEPVGGPRVQTAAGLIEGAEESGIRVFRGVPFARPPVGDFRWKAPQPVERWEGVRPAKTFGPRAMQLRVFDDMIFRSDGMGEDCLYLNVWTPAKSMDERLPVLVYFYGGGLFAGDGSEPRYDGEFMARKGVVALTVNYRLGVFGFFAHPALSAEAPYGSSGNYGFLDEAAALQWVRDNIAAFGGDPDRVTIAGESAGSTSVSAQMVSPLSRDLIAGAIGSSASILGTLGARPLADVEQAGVAFADQLGVRSLDSLRALPAQDILEATARYGAFRFGPVVDGYFFPRSPLAMYEAGEQANVPLLLGWNSEESNYRAVLGQRRPTVDSLRVALDSLYGERAPEVLAVYHPKADSEVVQVATDLASDRFTGFSTWKWADVHARTKNRSVYRYFYARPRPRLRSALPDSLLPPPPFGAAHSAEIEYAMGNLPTNRVYDWQPEDYRVSTILQNTYANFVKTGDPNGPGVPTWPALNEGETPHVLVIDAWTRVEPERHRERYLVLERLYRGRGE